MKNYCVTCGILGRFRIFDFVVRWHLGHIAGKWSVRLWWNEHALRRCGVCRRRNGTGHKMDCNREYSKKNW